MKKSTIILLVSMPVAIMLIYYASTLQFKGFIDVMLMSTGFGLLIGVLSSYLFGYLEQRAIIENVNKRLLPYMGNYDVHIWGQADKDFYKIELTIEDSVNSIVKVEQMGREDLHKLTGFIKIDETYHFGHGYYFHPEKFGKPNGEIRIFILDNKTISAEKFYLDSFDDNSLRHEKWHWRR